MKTIIRISLVALLLTACGCTKDALNELPPATQTGANTFGCKINGVVYKCSGYWSSTPVGLINVSEGVSGNYGNGEFAIYALVPKNNNHDRWNMSFKFKCNENEIGIYRDGIEFQGQSAIDNYDSKFTITRFDNNVISGTFQLKFHFNDKNDRTYEFSEGRFDIKRNN